MLNKRIKALTQFKTLQGSQSRMACTSKPWPPHTVFCGLDLLYFSSLKSLSPIILLYSRKKQRSCVLQTSRLSMILMHMLFCLEPASHPLAKKCPISPFKILLWSFSLFPTPPTKFSINSITFIIEILICT